MVHRASILASAVVLALVSSCIARPQGEVVENESFLPVFRRPAFLPFQGGLLRPPAQIPFLQPIFQIQGPLLGGPPPNLLQALPNLIARLQQAAGRLFNLGGNSSSGSGPLSFLTSPLKTITSLFSGNGSSVSPLQTLSTLSSISSALSSANASDESATLD